MQSNLVKKLSGSAPHILRTKSLQVITANLPTWKAMAASRQALYYKHHLALNQFSAIVLVLLTTGARVTEVLQIRKKDVSPCGTVFLHGLKGSCNRFFSLPFLLNFAGDATTSPSTLLFDVSYSALYAQIKIELNGVFHIPSQGRDVVTHWFRYSYVCELIALCGADAEQIARAIGHRNLTSTVHYLTRLQNG